MKSLIQEFKTFLFQKNVLDVAVAFVIGAAFTKLVEAVVKGVITPLVNTIGGNSNISLQLWIFDLGVVISAVITFVATAAAVFFFILKPLAKLKSLGEAPKDPSLPDPPKPATLDDVVAAIKELRK